MDQTEQEELQRQLDKRDKALFMKPGHCAGDLLEACKWKILREEPGRILRESVESSSIVSVRPEAR